jgi:acetyl-CoA carboxylase biotin carboxylase subunit
MLAKLIVWAPTRELAIERMRRALLELVIEGVETSRDFHLRLLEDAEFRRGEIDIQWLEPRLAALLSKDAPAEIKRAAVITAALLADRDRNHGRRVQSTVAISGSIAGALRAASHAASPNGVDEESFAERDGGWRRVARREGLR